jgi:type IV pilus assembly protein PilN
VSHINLLPWREKAKLKRKRDFGIVLSCCLLLVTSVGLGVRHYFVYQQEQQEQRNQILVREMAMLDHQLAEIKSIREKKKSLKERIQLIQTLQESRNVTTRLFNDIPQLTPAGVYLERLNLANSMVSVDGKSESNSRIARFMRQIEASTWLSTPSISSIVALGSEPIPLSKFQLKFRLQHETQGKEAP